jgi:hypothetical protein
MSEQTHAAIEQAVRKHFADEFHDEAGMATGWVLQVSGVLGTDADSSAHLRETPPRPSRTHHTRHPRIRTHPVPSTHPQRR